MNISKILLLTILSIPTLFAQKTTQITFKIAGYTEGTAQLVGVYADANYLADSAKISADGTIKFSKEEGYQEGFFYLLLPGEANFQLLIANGENFSVTATKGNFVNTLQVEQSLENKLFFENQRFQANLEQRFNSVAADMKKYPQGSVEFEKLKLAQQNLLKEREEVLIKLKTDYPNALFTKFKLAGQNPKYRFAYRPDGIMDSSRTMVNYREDWWDSFDFSESRLVRTPVFHNKLKRYISELTVQRPDSIVKSAVTLIDKTLNNKELFKVAANWITYNHKPSVGKIMDCDAIYSQLVLKYFTSDNAEKLTVPVEDILSMRKTATEMLPSFVGKIGQDVSARNKNDEFKSIYGLKSPITVVYIYNPDCEHCQEETPKLREVYDQWKSRGVEIYSIAANAKSREEWQGFVRKYGVNWTDVWDPQLTSGFNQKYYIDITPEMYVLDKNHKIIAKNLKAHQLPEVFQEELAKMK
jgi:thiol-disulfide isomerase/thioredoxin